MPGRVRRWIIAITGMVVGVLGLGALVPVDAVEGDVTYLLTWETSGIEIADDGSWTTTTDLGYTVTVTAGEVTTFSTTMVACEHDHGMFGWLFGVFGPRIAEAGHSDDADPALVGGPSTEPLISPASTEFGSVTVDEPAYCEGHVAWGSSDPEAPTLRITASWVAPDGSTGEIDLATTIDWGTGGDLSDPTGSVHLETGATATIEVRRRLATLFDGVDVAGADETELAMGVLRNLAAGTVFVVVDGIAHA